MMRNAMRFVVLGLTTVSLLFVHATGYAAIVAYEITDLPAAGNQAFPGTLGLDFTVNDSIAVYALGAFDSSQDGLSLPITVRLWTRDLGPTSAVSDDSGAEIISLLFPVGSPGTLEAGYRFQELLLPVALAPGLYTITAEGYGSVELNGNENAGAIAARQTNGSSGRISFDASRFGAPGNFPNLGVSPFGAGQFDAFVFLGPSFKYAPTPEPGTLLLIGSGLVGIGVGSRRRKRK